MKHPEALLTIPALMIATLLCMATTPAPFFAECALVDRVSAAAKAGLPTRSVALEILERIAEGRMQSASPDLEVQVGLEAGKLHGPEFKHEMVRSHAVRKIGGLDLPEALAYLQNLKKSDIGPDTSGQMWSSAQIALRQAQLNRIREEPAKVRFLEDTTTERGSAAWWAVQELCDRGSYQSLPFITQHIRKAYSLSQDVEHAVAFCEARMAIISRDPDRIKALGLFLSVGSGVTDPELLGWAINELRAINTPQAEAEVQRFADEIEALPDGSPLKNALWGKRVQIRGMMPPKRK